MHPGLGKDLVLKLSLTAMRPDGRCEIIEEGKMLGALDHPNVVRVHDSDFYEDRPYIVMESARGRTLEHVASERRLPCALLARSSSESRRGCRSDDSAGRSFNDRFQLTGTAPLAPLPRLFGG
jgi:serine/threonine protein kinase